MNNYISINIVSKSLILAKCINDNNCYSLKDIKYLSIPYGINSEISLLFAIKCGWIYDKEGYLFFTENGTQILDMFNGTDIGLDLWKKILSLYILGCHPLWAKRIPYGRMEAYIFMNEEEQRCFNEAGLMRGQTEDIVSWWDSLAQMQRAQYTSNWDDVGRHGERLTMKFEESRTGVRPDWRSIETNLSGYDILSQHSSQLADSLLIEVKSSQKSISCACAIISRHEWKVATLANNQERYLFYLWSLQPTLNQLAIITVHEMEKHIPVDHNHGEWESVRIPFSAFRSKFYENTLI